MTSTASDPVRIGEGDAEVLKTRGTLADGREIIFYDDSEQYLSGAKRRIIDDPRPLDARQLPPHESADIRVDPLTGDHVAIAAHRQHRTFMPPADEDPLAPAGRGTTPTEIPEPDYDVVVFENRFPSLQGPLEVLRNEPLFHETTPAGRCEVVCFTSDTHGSFAGLSRRRVRTVIEAWADRTAELQARGDIAQVFPFENRGPEIGVTLGHPHGQIYAYSYLPPYTRAVERQAATWAERTGGDLLGDQLEAERRDGTRIVIEGEHWTAFVPFAAKWPVDVQLAPHRAARSFDALTGAERDELATMYLDLLGRLDRFFDRPLPYIAGWHQTPTKGGDHISRMWLHVFSLLRSPDKLKFLAGSESAVGAWINDVTPERIASRLKEVAE